MKNFGKMVLNRKCVISDYGAIFRFTGNVRENRFGEKEYELTTPTFIWLTSSLICERFRPLDKK